MNESNEELRGVYIFTVLFPIFLFLFCFVFIFILRLFNQSGDRFGVATIYHWGSKIERTLSSVDKRPKTQMQVAPGKPE